ncbi:MAG: complex I subunit 5 family protein [Desulfurococcaceae archaeon]
MPAILVLTGDTPWSRKIVSLALLLKVIGYSLFLANITGKDPFMDFLLITSIMVSLVVSGYAVHYSKLKYGNLDLVPLVDLFAISMILVFTSSTVLELVVFWILAELFGFLLVVYDYIATGNTLSYNSALKYLLFSMIPTDVALFTLLALIGLEKALELSPQSIAMTLMNPVALLLVLVGFFAKAALFPLHFWLPDAHSAAPSPASALLSGVMVNMGIFALYLLSHCNMNENIVVPALLLSGSITAIYGAIQASLQSDIKRLLAYSTTSNVALVALMIGLYISTEDIVFVEASIVYTIAHTLYKASLFLDTGFIENLVHERNLRKLGYISSIAPTETVSVLLTVLTIFGLPPSMGFLAKLFLFASIAKYLEKSWLYILMLAIVALKTSLAVVYNVNYLRAHIGRRRSVLQAEVIKGAFILQPYVLALVLSAFLFSFMVTLFSYLDYVEFMLLRKATLILVVTFPLLLFTIYFFTNMFKRSGTVEAPR